jgi:hypothetical protein
MYRPVRSIVILVATLPPSNLEFLWADEKLKLPYKRFPPSDAASVFYYSQDQPFIEFYKTWNVFVPEILSY